MKKWIYMICSIAGFALFAFLALVEINNVVHVVDTTNFQPFIEFIQKYGALIIVGVLCFASFLGKTVLRVLLVILFLAIGLLYALSTFAPDLVAKMFGVAKQAAEDGSAEAVVTMLSLL